MAEFEAKVSFYDTPETAIDALLSVADEHLAIEVAGRPIGRWPINDLSPQVAGDSVVVSAEGERLVIDVTDPDALSISLRASDAPLERPVPPDTRASEDDTTGAGTGAQIPIPDARHVMKPEPPTTSIAGPSVSPSNTPDADPSRDEPQEPASSGAVAGSLREEMRNLRVALETAQTQLRWVLDLMPRRLAIPLRGEEEGLGVVQGVHLKERRPLPESGGRQPWVVVDSGNVYVTTRRLVFSGAQDVEFEFDEINKKGASHTGLLLGVSSRSQAHILAGPGDRLAVVLTAAEKIANGHDPTVPFRGAISRLMSQIEALEERMDSIVDTPTEPREPSGQSASAF